LRNQKVSPSSGGPNASKSSVSRAFSRNMMVSTPAIISTSCTRYTTTWVYISLMAATSLVARVTSRPTGWRSRKPMGSRSTCPNMARRMSNMIRCPAYCRMYTCP